MSPSVSVAFTVAITLDDSSIVRFTFELPLKETTQEVCLWTLETTSLQDTNQPTVFVQQTSVRVLDDDFTSCCIESN